MTALTRTMDYGWSLLWRCCCHWLFQDNTIRIHKQSVVLRASKILFPLDWSVIFPFRFIKYYTDPFALKKQKKPAHLMPNFWSQLANHLSLTWLEIGFTEIRHLAEPDKLTGLVCYSDSNTYLYLALVSHVMAVRSGSLCLLSFTFASRIVDVPS